MGADFVSHNSKSVRTPSIPLSIERGAGQSVSSSSQPSLDGSIDLALASALGQIILSAAKTSFDLFFLLFATFLFDFFTCSEA